MQALTKSEAIDIQLFAEQIRLETVRAIQSVGVGHVGGSFSIAECLACLYGKEMNVDCEFPDKETRDRLVLSKGHCGPALYATLAIKGFFPKDWLLTLNNFDTKLPSHCDRNLTPGVDMTTGSLGQGASTAAGVALGIKMKGLSSKVYLILGDGELQEGQVWEMLLFANQQKLNNLITFVDNNHLQLDGPTDEINSLGNIRQKFSDFGWYAENVDGHNVQDIIAAIERCKSQTKPSCIVLETVKGKGYRKIENKTYSHSMEVDKEEAKRMTDEINLRVETLTHEKIF